MLSEHLQQLLSESALSDSERQRFEAVLKQVTAAAEQVAGDNTLEADARRIASALYNFTSAVVLAWEAARIGDDLRRLALAKLVLSHKLLPRDPLKPEAGDGAWLAALLAETPLSRDQVDAVWEE